MGNVSGRLRIYIYLKFKTESSFVTIKVGQGGVITQMICHYFLCRYVFRVGGSNSCRFFKSSLRSLPTLLTDSVIIQNSHKLKLLQQEVEEGRLLMEHSILLIQQKRSVKSLENLETGKCPKYCLLHIIFCRALYFRSRAQQG